jgi:hypothetical protein
MSMGQFRTTRFIQVLEDIKKRENRWQEIKKERPKEDKEIGDSSL